MTFAVATAFPLILLAAISLPVERARAQDRLVIRNVTLIDGISDVRTKMREVFGENVRFKLMAPSTSWLRRKRSVSFGTGGFDFRLWPEGLTADVLSTIEARALWSRFGL